MEEKRSFLLLGIEQTKDEGKIREAYLKKLPEFHPEDDPEGFRRLRTAYEEAIACARASEEEAEIPEEETKTPEEETPSGRFVKKAEALYASMHGRRDENAWRELFFDEAFLDLEEEENCREKLFVFMMEHYYFPTAVWKVLDEKLCIRQGREELYERFPRDFVDYAVRKAALGEEFDFGQLTGPEEADTDQFLRLFSQAAGEEADGNDAALERTLLLARETGVSHPDMEMKRARLCLRRKRDREGRQIVEQLLSGAFGRAHNVLYQCAEFFREAGERERSAALYESLKEECPRHYMANLRLAEEYLEQEKLEKAKSCMNILLSYPMGETAEKLADRVNKRLEEALRRQLEQEPDKGRARMELGWCLLQTDRGEEAIRMLEKLTPDAQEEKDYCNLMGKACFHAKRFEEAELFLRRWEALLREGLAGVDFGKEDITEQVRSDRERICTAHSMLAQIYVERAEKKEGEERDRYFRKALEEIEEAERVEKQPGLIYAKGQILFRQGKYEECVGRMEALEQDAPDFAAAYMLHQKACAECHDASGVLECHETLRRLVPSDSRTWEYAAQVWYELGRKTELETLLRDAGENGVDTGRLRRYQYFPAFRDAGTKGELSDAVEKASGIVQCWETEGWTPEEKGDFCAEMARSLWRLERYGDAQDWIGRALELEPSNSVYLYIHAGLLKEEGLFEDALEVYGSCRKDYDETPHFYANVGECLYESGQYEKALPVLKKAVELREDNPESCWYVVRCLERQIRESGSLESLPDALRYAELLGKYGYAAQGFLEKGYLWILAGEYESAKLEFKRAVLEDPENPFAHSNLSRMYGLTGCWEQALEEARKAAGRAENDPSPFHDQVLGRAYTSLHRYPEALDAIRTLWKRYPGLQAAYLDDMIHVLVLNGKWQEALECVRDKRGELGREAYTEKVIEIYIHAKRYEEAVKYVKRHGREAGMFPGRTEELLADIRWCSGELEEAGRRIDCAAAEMTGKGPGRGEVWYKAARIWFYAGKRDKARDYALRALEYYEKKYGIEAYLNVLDSRLQHVYRIASLRLYAGEIQKARILAERMKGLPMCLNCRFGSCTDVLELEAGILEAEGEIQKAAALYERILEENGQEPDVRMKLQLVRKQERRRLFEGVRKR